MIAHPVRRTARRAYTLLEVILALGIGAVLFAGLYAALGIVQRGASTGRSLLDQTSIARGVIDRLNGDIAAQLAPSDPRVAASSSPTTTTPSSTTPTTGTTANASGTPSTGSTSGAGTGTVKFNLGVQGDSTWVAVYVSRVPSEIQIGANATNGGNGANGGANNGMNSNQGTPLVADLRRVAYWLASNGGLARQELTNVASTDALADLPPSVSDEKTYVIAPQVQSVTFEYFDGTTWQTSWDGTAAGAAGTTPLGPPAAIRVTLTVGRTVNGTGPADLDVRTYQHVVPIPTANNPNPPAASSSSGSSTPSAGGSSS